MGLQVIAIVLAVVGLALFYSGVAASVPTVTIALVIFVAIDLYGLFTGRLYCSPFALLPILPALFVRPWFIGLAWGFVVISSVDALIEAERSRGGRVR